MNPNEEYVKPFGPCPKCNRVLAMEPCKCSRYLGCLWCGHVVDSGLPEKNDRCRNRHNNSYVSDDDDA